MYFYIFYIFFPFKIVLKKFPLSLNLLHVLSIKPVLIKINNLILWKKTGLIMSYTVDSNKYLIYFKRIFLIVSKFRKKYADLTGDKY